jgi:aminoglycoside phosphotransferase family enzyme/predicted kinase
MTTEAPNAQARMNAWLEMVHQLAVASDWPAGDKPIETIQTHISVVLIGKHHALKLKKPVDFGFLDYTTLEKRHLACEAEVRLNQRLCSSAYLGVKPIYEVSGQPSLSGGGPILDYAVWMKRLPSDRMLDRIVARDDVTESIIDRIAERVSAFHRVARRGPDVDLYGHPDAIRKNWDENFTQTAPYVGRTVTASEFEAISDWVTRWMGAAQNLLSSRLAEGWICDGHGDMRSESICVTDDICIFDCIEFNDRFRCGDAASEVAFLAMDLDARGRPDLGYYFTECYNRRVQDRDLFALLAFYRCYRAYVRGKVLSFRLDEPGFSLAELASAEARAKSYFHLARRYASPLNKPAVILVAGLSGTGKTSVARALAGELGLRVVSADAIRKFVFGTPERPYEYGEGPYTGRGNRITYDALLQTGLDRLAADKGVILDATFRDAAERARAAEMAVRARAAFKMIECKLSTDLVKSRIDRRAFRHEGLSDASWHTYLRQREEFDPFPDDPSGLSHLVLDTRQAISLTAHTATDWLRATLR